MLKSIAGRKSRRVLVSGIVAAFLFVASAGFVTVKSHAQELGVALFAMQAESFPCEQALKFFDRDSSFTSLAILWGTFGSDNRCVLRWAELMRARGVKHSLQIHISNETCRRRSNRACTAPELAFDQSVNSYNRKLEQGDPATIAALRERVRAVRALAEQVRAVSGEQISLIASTGLEDNYTVEAYRRVLEVVRSEWPYLVVRNPVELVKDRPQLSADLFELHGNKPVFESGQRCIANLDGVDIVFPHRRSPTSTRISWKSVQEYVAQYRPRCDITYLWSAPWQGLRSDKFPEPEKRRYVVSDEDVAAIRSLASGTGAPSKS